MGKRYAGLAVVMALVAVALLLGLPQAGAVQAEDVTENPVSKQLTHTLYPATAVTTSTVNTASPRMDAYSRDVSLINGWSLADVFVNIDGTGTFTLVATPQFSADGIDWASGTVSDAISRTLTADGTALMRVPLAGEYLRVQMAVTGVITPTVKVTYRN